MSRGISVNTIVVLVQRKYRRLPRINIVARWVDFVHDHNVPRYPDGLYPRDMARKFLLSV